MKLLGEQKHAHVGHREPNDLAALGRQQYIVIFRAGPHPDQFVTLIQLHGDLAVPLDVSEITELVAPHTARRGGKHDVKITPGGFIFGHRHDGVDRLVRLDR